MSDITITASKSGITASADNSDNKISLKERFKKFWYENTDLIVPGAVIATGGCCYPPKSF